MPEYEYDVALSFAGENRSYVQSVAEALRESGISVFYDDFEKIELWGKDLSEFLDQIYRLKSKYCVIFISKHFVEKAWTTHERRSAVARAIEEKGEYILPARFDDTEVPGLQPTVGFIDLRNLNPPEFAELILKKIRTSATKVTNDDTPHFRIPRVHGTSINPYSAAIEFMIKVKNEIENRCNSLSHPGVSVSTFGQDREHSCCCEPRKGSEFRSIGFPIRKQRV